MKPPFSLTPAILNLCTEISRLLGQQEGLRLNKPEPKLRKSNRIRTVQASLAIEGNTLELDQVTALLEGKRVAGPKREIIEVQNAIRAYDRIGSFKPYSAKSLCEAHAILMADLVPDAGKWRKTNVGIFQGKKIAHTAPQSKRVPELMEDLLTFIKTEEEIHPLILSAIFHYELEFIHPFSDGNGRIGRLWQTVLLSRYNAVFEFTPVESVVRDRQTEYYKALGLADKAGHATPFIEFSLSTILEALSELNASIRPQPLKTEDRLRLAGEQLGKSDFSRKDYLNLFKTISTATASRDLSFGVKNGLIEKAGEKALTRYRFI